MNLSISSSYQSLNEALAETDAQLHPSEAHGLLCGILCVDTRDQLPFKEWVAGAHCSDQADQAILALYQELHEQLVSGSFALQLYLPEDDETHLAKRAEALSLWCQGFLVGLKLAGVASHQINNDDVKEALNDLAELSKMQYDAVIDTEEDEVAYTELVEYVRVAAMLVHDTLKGMKHDYHEHI